MLLDIFSRFDDHNQVFINISFLLWLIGLGAAFTTLSIIWARAGKTNTIISLKIIVAEELVSRTQRKEIGGALAIFVSLIIILINLNLLGLVPYIFRLTRHLAINLALSFPIWLRIVMSRIRYDLGSFLAHLQPLGSPSFLNPPLCIIELVRLIVRPITLSVRLTANLRTGHILIRLLGVGFTGSALGIRVVILVIGTFYYMFEIAVCCIQAYIFTLLPTLYSDEHPSDLH